MSNNINLLGEQFQEIMKQHSERMKKITEPLLNLQKLPVFEELQKNMQDLSRLTEGIALKNQKAFERIADLNDHSGLKALSEQVELMSRNLTANLSIDLVNPVLKDLQSSLNGLEISEDRFLSALEKLEKRNFVEEFENTVSNIEKGHSTAQGISIGVSEVLAFLMFILMLIQTIDNSTEKELSEEQELTNQLLQSLVGNTDKLINKSKNESLKLLIANEAAPLRTQPDINSDTLITLFKGQHLDFLKKKDNWYKVQYYDFSVSRTGIGWVQRKHIIPEVEIGQAQAKELGEVADYINGRAFKPKEWKTEGLPIIRIQNLNDESASYNYSDEGHKEKYKVRKGDLLFAWSASLDAYIWKGNDAWLNQHIFKVVPKDFINKFFLYYYLKSIIGDLYAKSHGSGMVHVTKKKFEKTEIFVPPLPIQHRIVSKIEEFFSDLDNGIKNLEKAKKQLETYKQSVLKAAFEGKLTKEWRKQQDDLPTPEELKAQIEKERKRYREQQLEEWDKEVEEWKEEGEPGRKPRKPRKQKTPKKLSPKEIEQFPKIPLSWSWLRFGNIVSKSQNGLSKRNSNKGTPVTVLRLSDINNGRVKSNGFRQIKLSGKEIKKYLLDKNDLLFIRVNGSMSLAYK